MSRTPQRFDDLAGVADANEGVLAARAEIDMLDAEIAELVHRRIKVSRDIQDLRIAHGGVRIEPSRELAIVARYSNRLGSPGAEFAGVILRMSRGC